MSETFNGWSNRSTWTIHLHITNDPGLMAEAVEIARQGADDAKARLAELGVEQNDIGRANAAGDALHEWLNDWLYEQNETLCTDARSLLIADLLLESLRSADWREIGAAILEIED